MKKFIFDTSSEVADQFANHFKNLSAGKSEFHVALSGGSTPKILFDIIVEKYASQFDWSKIHLWWGDERCVPPADNESNYRMTLNHLISHINIPEGNIHRVLGENKPAEEAKRYAAEIEATIPSKNGLPYFDLIMLGMGPDGHTASIFPHQMYLLESDDICEVATHPESGQHRITLTGKTINNAAVIAFLVTGGNKTEKITSIFNKDLNHELYPAAHIDPRDGELIWFLDNDAWGNN
ncbi:MAG: 6-phosphogluconolactonase [Cyclobacteriaceae bacterium]|jgi:6-phosphogluconolactonase